MTTPLRVLMDYRPARHGRGGIAVYTRELAAAYAALWPDALLSLWAHRLRSSSSMVEGSAPRGARQLEGRLPSLALTTLARFGLGADRFAGGVDVVHWTDYVELPSTRAPVVATVHDVLFRELPTCYTADMRRGLETVMRRILARARRLVVPSHRSRDALVGYYGVHTGRIDVVPHGVRPLPEAPPAREHGRFLLSVGTLEPRKNLARLLQAHELLRREDPGLVLVVAGPRGWMDGALVDALHTQRGVVWEERPDVSRLAALYRGALALAYPSLGEGFGLPVLEAMSEGVVPVIGRGTTCEDVAGDAGIAVDPYDVDALAGALLRVAGDAELRGRLGERGRERARAYTWERAARRTRASYEKALAS